MIYQLPKKVLLKIQELACDDFTERHRQTLEENLDNLCYECALESPDDIASDILHYHNPEEILRSAAHSFITGEFADCKTILSQRMVEYFGDDIKHEYNKTWDNMQCNYDLSIDNDSTNFYFEYGLKRGDFA